MTRLRALLFYILAITVTLAMTPAGAAMILLAPRRRLAAFCTAWARTMLWLLRRTTGLGYQVRGLETLPAGPVVIAAKHQSAFETLIFQVLLGDPAYVLKRELLRLPVVGVFLARVGNIPIDRSAGARALKDMIALAGDRARDGRPIVIFPEGTRTPPGTTGTYHPGIAALYGRLGLPVVPVAVNSGVFWAREALDKHPGTITLRFLPAIAPGLDRRAFLARLHGDIENASRALEAEAGFTSLPAAPPAPGSEGP